MLGGHVATSFESDQVDHRWRTGLNTAQLIAEASDNKGERGGSSKFAIGNAAVNKAMTGKDNSPRCRH